MTKIYWMISFLLFGLPFLHGSEEPITQNIHQDEFAKRRSLLKKTIGNNSIMIVLSSEPKNQSNDVDYPFRQANNIFYLTGIKQEGTTLVLIPGSERRTAFIFVKDRNPSQETWTGKILSHEEVTKISGIDNVYSSNQFEGFLNSILNQRSFDSKPNIETHEFDKFFEALKSGSASVYFTFTQMPGLNGKLTKEFELASKIRDRFIGVTIRDSWPVVRNMRQIKSSDEIQLLRKAIDISLEGHLAAWRGLKPGIWEYEVQSNMESVFKSKNAEWAYPSIIASGPNATTLHYQTSDRQSKDGELFLMDAAAAYDYYSADVTRTVPVNGKFSPEQAAIYEIVYAAQEACLKKIKPGLKLPELDNVASEIIKEGLKKLGLITDTNGDQYKMWLTHGVSHWIGLDVHDGGDKWRPLQPGMVFTIEPGIYIREDTINNLPKTSENQNLIDAIRPAFEKYKNIGVRIEDDILVTKDGYENLSKKLPRSLDDIESFLRNR